MRSLIGLIFAQDNQNGEVPSGIYNPALAQEWWGAKGEDFIAKLIAVFLHLMLIGAGIASLFYLIMGGIQWITSGGDKAGVAAARDKITSAFIGLVIVAAIFAFINFLAPLLGIEFLKTLEITLPGL